ncbi:MAG: hypothetical protein KF752_08110 [Pirellulaceae bacterium]|nr:hypothetical protein [Pirellulaceae bacterium]
MSDKDQRSNGLFGSDGFNPSWEAAGNIAFGGLQAAGGAIVAVPSVIGLVAPEPLTTAAGAVGAVWSADQIQAGSRTFWAGLFGGDAVESFGSSLLGGGALGFLYDLGPSGVTLLKKGADFLKGWKALKEAGKLADELKAMSPQQLDDFLEQAKKNLSPEEFKQLLDDLEELNIKPPGVKASVRPVKVVRRVNQDEAREWLKKNRPDLSDADIESYLKSFDSKMPLEIVEVPEGFRFETYKYPSRIDPNAVMSGTHPPGFVTDVGSDPSMSAILLPGRSPGVATTIQPTEALRGTTANWTDFDYASGIGGRGGNSQYIFPQNSASFDGFGPH